jgi:NADH:ubiquinone oxidoreductase subunit E
MLGILKALRTTVRHLPQKTFTVQYPEERVELPERSRGLFKVVVDLSTGEARCRACTLCETNCPVQVIRVDHHSRYALPAVDEEAITRRRLEEQGSVDVGPAAELAAEQRVAGEPLSAVLRRIQRLYGYLPRRALDEFSRQAAIPLSEVYGAASTSEGLRLSPPGAVLVAVCRCPACQVAGADRVEEALEEALDVCSGKTTDDGRYTLGSAAGTVACARPPVVLVGDEVHFDLSPQRVRELAARLRAGRGAG